MIKFGSTFVQTTLHR